MAVYGFRDGKFSPKKLQFPDKLVVQYVIPQLATVGTANLVSAWNPHAATTAKLAKHLLIQPPYPVAIGVCPNVAGSAGHTDRLTIVGKDISGQTVTEVLPIAGTAASSLYTNNAFAYVTSITPSNSAGIVPKTTSIAVHTGRKVGLPHPLATTGDIVSYAQNGVFATAYCGGATLSTTYNTLSIPLSQTGKGLYVTYKTKFQN